MTVARDMPGPAAGPPLITGAEAPESPREAGQSRKLLYATLPGCWGALIAGCLSFTPSLLPRSGIIQGIVWGITAAIGYGLGVIGAWIWRAFADREPRRPRRRSWLAFFISAAVLTVVFFGLGQYWQYLIRKLMGVTEYNIVLVVASPCALVLSIPSAVLAAIAWSARHGILFRGGAAVERCRDIRANRVIIGEARARSKQRRRHKLHRCLRQL